MLDRLRSLWGILAKGSYRIAALFGVRSFRLTNLLVFQFVEYLLAQSEVVVEKVRDVFIRACNIHHPKKLNIHLKWSAFEETYGNAYLLGDAAEKNLRFLTCIVIF